jgi:hypothetical protein
MTKLPLGLALLLAASFAVEGCASKPAVAVAPPPASDFPVKPAETKSDAVAERPPGWSATQVTASARYVRISRAMPEAKGALAFLADEAALRAGTLTLTKAQADAALVELAQITKREPISTLAVTVVSGNAARIKGRVSQAMNGKEEPTVMINGIPMVRRNDEDIELAISPNVSAAGMIRMEVEMQATSFDGFIEYGDKLVTVAPGGEGGNPPQTTVRIPKGFYQPIFSTQSVKAEVQMASGGVIVLCADRAKSDAPEGLVDKTGQAIKSVPPETMLVFLTAAVSPTKRAD